MQEAQGRRGTGEAVATIIGRRRERSILQKLGRFAREYPLGTAGALVLLLLVFVAVFAPVVARYDHLITDVPNRLTAPGSQFWLGSDALGRDAYSRIVFGSRVSLRVGLLSVIFGTLIGTSFGIASGYIGGWYDLVAQRLVDAFMGFPSLVLALALVVGLGASVNNVTLAIGIVLIPRMIRLSRSSALSIKEEVYVLAAQAIGASRMRIMLRHVTPNSLAPVFVLATGYLGTAIVTEASLSFLGLGVPPPNPTLGGMLREGSQGSQGYLEAAPWLTIFPGLALSAIVFSFAFLGDALRDAFDPRLRR